MNRRYELDRERRAAEQDEQHKKAKQKK